MASAWNDTKWARLLSTIILLALIGYGGFLRFHDIDVSLFDDEINTRERALQSVEYTLSTRNYPLYYLSAKAALNTFGDTETALRLPSFIAGLLGILALFGLVCQLHSRTAGLIAAALLTFNPFHITHSNFARYYALLLLFTILTVWMLHLALERGRWHQWLGYTAAAFLALASHIVFLPALVMLNAGGALYLLGQRGRGSLKRRFLQVVLLGCCTLLSCGFLIYKDVGPARFFKDFLTFGNNAASAATEEETETVAETNVPESQPAAMGELPEEAWPGPSILEAHQQRPQGGGAEFRNPETGKTEVLLTYYDCLEYLKRYFWTDTTWVWPALIVVGIWGFVDLLYRVPSVGLPLFFGFFFSPLPFFFLATDRWYHPRYFSYLFVFGLIAIAIGTCVLPRFLSRVIGDPRSLHLWRRVPTAKPTRTFRVANVIYIVLVGVLAVPVIPAINESYQTYPVTGYLPRSGLVVNRIPERDWRGLYEFVARTVRDGDQFLFMSPKGEHGPRYARYYFSKFLPWAEEEIHFDQNFGAPTVASMEAFARETPMANLWCVGYIKYGAARYAQFMNAAGGQQVDFSARNRANGLFLYYLGAPTTNHIGNGSFETRAPKTLPEVGERDSGEAYNGFASFRIDYPVSEVGDRTSWRRYASLPVAPASYRLRNNGFEAWNEDGVPVGWTVRAADPSLISVETAGFKESNSLRLTASDEATVLVQSIPVGLAPGRTIEVQMMGISDVPNDLQLVLRYQGPGYQREAHTVHPGTGSWVRMKMAEELPADVDPESIAIEIWRMPSTGAPAIVDDVELRVADAGGSLEPGQPYVVSLALRSENLVDRRGSDRQPAGFVRLRWEDAAGEKGHYNLVEVNQESAWRLFSVPFTPGVEIPLDLKELKLEVGLENGTGTIWIDQVQLEKGTRPTPFSDSFRLPHDEALAHIDLTPYEVTDRGF